jgi:hypothetical protein
MCIISFYKQNDKIILTHNRDEKISRTASLEVEERKWNDKTFFSPVDKAKNGTWIFYSEQYIACILNGGREKPKGFKTKYKKSRGIILLNLMKYDSVQDYLKSESFEDIAPFTIFVFERVSKKTFLLFWDEKKLEIKDLTDNEFVFRASSTLYSLERIHDLENIFHKFNKPSSKAILDIHQSIVMKDGDVEKGKATTSITQIIADSSSVSMKYCPF